MAVDVSKLGQTSDPVEFEVTAERASASAAAFWPFSASIRVTWHAVLIRPPRCALDRPVPLCP